MFDFVQFSYSQILTIIQMIESYSSKYTIYVYWIGKGKIVLHAFLYIFLWSKYNNMIDLTRFTISNGITVGTNVCHIRNIRQTLRLLDRRFYNNIISLASYNAKMIIVLI